MNHRKHLEEFTPDEWRTLMAANLDGPFLVTRALLPAMKARRRGKIINVCSLAADLGTPEHRPVCGEQGRAADADARARRGGCAVEHPGERHLSGILQDRDECAAHRRRRVLELGRAAHAGGRWGEPPEIAGAAVFLASAAADYVTGHVLYVDGGFSAAY